MSEETGGLIYIRLENGIHEFGFEDSDKKTVDAFFKTLEHILTTTPHTDTARYILNITGNGQISLVAMTQRFRRLEAQIPHRARGRTAVIHNPALILSFIDGFVRALAPSRDITRFFTLDRRQEAIDWLLSQ